MKRSRLSSRWYGALETTGRSPGSRSLSAASSAKQWDLKPGSKALDAACGTGHVALAAARRFCEATGVDYVPSLLEIGRKRAALEGIEVTFEEGDVENIPFPDESFDYVLSTIGAMFAPNQERTAEELLRVCRREGTVGMVTGSPKDSWVNCSV